MLKKENRLLLVLLFAMAHLNTAICSEQEDKARAEIEKCLGSTVELRREAAPLRHYVVLKDGETAGYLFSSKDLDASSKGYRGMVEVMLLSDTQGRFLTVFVGENKETPSYLRKFQERFTAGKFKGKSLGEVEPDAVSGATYTSNAVRQGIKNISGKLDSIQFFKKVDPGKK